MDGAVYAKSRVQSSLWCSFLFLNILIIILSVSVKADSESELCWFTDISPAIDGIINMTDFSVLASYWLDECNADNTWCYQADFDGVNGVDINDLMTLLNCWCVEDNEPPSQDPALWQVIPQIADGSVDTIEMVAAQVRDGWWPDRMIEYYFDCTEPVDGPDRDWSVDRSFMLSGLLPDTYRYVVRARDGSGNETPNSIGYEVAVGAGAQLPQAEWVWEPNELTETSIFMQAKAYEDYDNMLPLPPEYTVKYEFEATTDSGAVDGRDYLPDPGYTDEVETNNLFSYRVRMGLFYESMTIPEEKLLDGPWSDEVSVILGTYDTTKPTPDPAEFDMFPEVHKVNPFYFHRMKAVIASDLNGVEYRFISTNGHDSGWRNEDNTAGEINPLTQNPIEGPHEYWIQLTSSYNTISWKVMCRDASPQHNQVEDSSYVQVIKMY